MSKIEDLKQKIYTPTFLGRRRKANIPSEPRGHSENPWSEETPPSEKLKVKKGRHYLAIITGILLGTGVLFGLGYASIQSGILFYFLGRSDVEMHIFADPTIVAGQKTTYTVSYKNKGRQPIKNIELFFQYPKSSEPELKEGFEERFSGTRVSIPEIPGGGEGTYQFRARIFGKEGDKPSAKATFVYQSENLGSKFTLEETRSIEISRVPIAITFRGGGKVRSGEVYEFDIEYASNAQEDFHTMYVRVFYPENFRFQKASIMPDMSDAEAGTWSLGTVQPGTSGTINVKGIIGGSPLEPKTFKYGLGVYSPETREWIPYVERTAVAEIIAPPLFIDMRTGDNLPLSNVSFGDNVRLRLIYKNNHSIPLSNVSVEAKVSGPIDFSTLFANGGLSAGPERIRWTATTEQKLSSVDPGAEGDLFLSFNLKRSKDVLTGSSQNQEVIIEVTIDAEKTQAIDVNLLNTQKFTLPINANILFQAKALYTGPLIANSGPIPPKVGVATTYTIAWELEAQGNNLTDAKVKGILPPYVRWTNVLAPTDEKISFRKETGEVLWDAGSVSVSGLNGENVRRVFFQIEFIPSESQSGNSAELLSKVTGTAIDTFTKKELIISGPAQLTTNLIDDFGVPLNSGTISK